MIDISVIIVNFNAVKMLTDCLNSLMKYTFGLTYEVIVVDNNSSDCNIKKYLNEKFPDVILISNNENLGFSKANNLGIDIARGKYLVFLNNDTIFIENTLEKVHSFAESLNFNSIIGCKLLNADGSWQPSFAESPNIKNIFTSSFFLYLIFPKSRFFNKYYMNYEKITKPIEVDYVMGAFIFCKTDIIKKLKGFDTRFYFYSEEIDLCARFKQNFGKILYYPEAEIIHLGGSTAKKNNWFFYKNKSISLIQFYQKYYTGINYGIFLIIYYIGLIVRFCIYLIKGVFLDKDSWYKSLIYLKLFFIYPQNKFKKDKDGSTN